MTKVSPQRSLDRDTFEPGPPIDSRLVQWLNANAGPRLLQLPVEIRGGPLGIAGAYLRSGDTEIAIALDTGALSLDLPMVLAQRCTYPCRVWLEGTWGALIPDGLPQTIPTFAVRRFVGIADERDTRIRLVKGPR